MSRKWAREVHVRIACPEIKYPDFYGVDMLQKRNFLYMKKVLRKCANYIKAKTLKFLSIDGMYKALTGPEILITLNLVTTILQENLIKPSDNLRGLKIKQLSLLSGKQVTSLR